MIRRRLRQILLPVGLFGIICGAILACVYSGLVREYRDSANRELTKVIGVMAEQFPEGDFSEVVRQLQQPGADETQSATMERGREVLASYGYYPEDFVSPSSERFGWLALAFSLLSFAVLAILLSIYFWWQDWRRERQLASLVNYLQDLENHFYDLRLDENSEGGMSLLTNELFKITVALQEAAEMNRLHSQNLETALADISHQLRTPLTSLQIMVDNIYDDPEMPVEVRQDFLRSISRQIEGMSSLVMTLLNLAKFDNASIKLKRRQTSIGDLFDNVIQNLEILADLQGVELATSGGLDARVSLDSKWQTEALTNIVKNCIEHSNDGSKVEMHAEDCPLFLKIVISDTGEGIASNDLRHIFERFYKAKNSAVGSVGIGLAFAKTIIEADNGQVSVQSEVGQGTKFTIIYFK